MKYDELRNKLTLKVKPWELKIIVNAINVYAPDSKEAAEYPEEFWIFVKTLKDELLPLEFLDSIIDKPDDRGMLGPTPKIE